MTRNSVVALSVQNQVTRKRKRGHPQEPQYLDPAQVGHWEGDDFVFDRPQIIGGKPMHRLVTTGMVLEPGITRDDVIHALINPSMFEELSK